MVSNKPPLVWAYKLYQTIIKLWLPSVRPFLLWQKAKPSQLHPRVRLSFVFTFAITSFANAQPPASPSTDRLAQPLTNQLIDHPSPYLALHASDPVAWQLWGQTILDQAKQQNKLIFISSGYFSCHWCHVMQQENYQDSSTATFLNEAFINVKIDRELNPGLDQALIEFARQHSGQAGWPQHVILTPQGYPFAAFIYQPNATFKKTLQRVQTLWQQQPKKLQTLAKNNAQKSQNKQIQVALKPLLSPDISMLKQQLIKQVRAQKDSFSGGLQGTSKFPKAPLLNNLLRLNELPKEIDEWLIFSLQQMQSQHLFDHIHGGFYRYTTDPEWQTPHFEKMLYNNALLIQTYVLAHKKWQDKSFLNTAQQTLDYLNKHLYNTNIGLYLGSQSALDKNGIEGGNYLWRREALQKQLSPAEFTLVEKAWQLNQTPPYAQGWHPKPTLNAWSSIQTKLSTPADKIPTDSKALIGWNGLMLSSLSQYAALVKDSAMKQRAQQIANKLIDLLLQSQAPRALNQHNKALGQANLQDFAYVIQGLKDYQLYIDKQAWQTALTQLENKAKRFFNTPQGWRYAALPILPQQQNGIILPDNPMPSPTALLYSLVPALSQAHIDKIQAQPINHSSYLSVPVTTEK